MRFAEQEDRILFLYMACFYRDVPEPAVLLADLGCPEGRRAWDAVWREDFEVRLPMEVAPSVAFLRGGGEPPVVSVATGRKNLKRIVRQKLGEGDAFWGLLQPPPGHFCAAVFDTGPGVVHPVPIPPADRF